MKCFLGSVLAVFLGVSPVMAAGTINSLPPIAPFPLLDPGNPLGSVENLWITNGNGPGTDWRITPTQLGYIFQGPVAPVSPFRYQYWWNTSLNPTQLQIFDGSQWIEAGALDFTAHTWQISNANLAPGNYPGITGVGTLTSGVWDASVIQPAFGGTGVNNGTDTITLGGPFSTSTPFDQHGTGSLSLITSGATSATFPPGVYTLAPLTSPHFITPDIGVATGTSLALGGATIGSNALAVLGTTSLTGNEAITGNVTVTGRVNLTGNLSAAAWSTAGVRYSTSAGTLTDTSSSGTVAAGATSALAGDSIAAASPVTFTSYYNEYISKPVASANVTFGNAYALGVDSLLVNGQITMTGGSVPHMINGQAQVVGTSGIVMPAAKSDFSCFSPVSSIIDYGLANGNPAGGSYTSWNCASMGGAYSWTDAGATIATISTQGMNLQPANTFNGYFATPQSGTGASAFGTNGAWANGLALNGGTYTTAAIVLNATATGSLIYYDADNQTALTGNLLTGVYGITAGGNLAATFAKGLVQVGATAPIHLASGQSTPPSLSACGTSPAIVGTDTAGQVTMGTGTPTGCVITFNAAYTAAPLCTVTWAATPLASQSYAVSNTAITLTQTATDSNVVNYQCTARAGG